MTVSFRRILFCQFSLSRKTFPATHELSAISLRDTSLRKWWRQGDDDKVNVPVQPNNLCSNCCSSVRMFVRRAGARGSSWAVSRDVKVGLFLLGIMKIIPARSNADGEAHFYARVRCICIGPSKHICLWNVLAKTDSVNSAWWIKYLAAL